MTDTHSPPISAALLGLFATVLAWGWLSWQGMSAPAAAVAALLLGGSVGVASAGMASSGELVGRLRWLLWPQIAAVVVITWMAYLHILPTTLLRFPYSDKILHFTLFGLVAFFAELWLQDRRWGWGRLRLPVSIVLPLSLAATEELAQTLSPHRTADLGDLACDLAGMSLAWLLARRLSAVGARVRSVRKLDEVTSGEF